MIAMIVHVTVTPEHADAFVEATLENARGARTEAGNFRFDVLRDTERENVFHLVEVYADEAAVDAHRETPHYRTWKETVEPWMAAPRTKDVCSVVFPEAATDMQ